MDSLLTNNHLASIYRLPHFAAGGQTVNVQICQNEEIPLMQCLDV